MSELAGVKMNIAICISFLWAVFDVVVTSEEGDHSGKKNCSDINHQVIVHGNEFIPSSQDACTRCLCQDGRAERCISVLCMPPKYCRHVQQLTDHCCEFLCLDTNPPELLPTFNITVKDNEDGDSLSPTNLGLRLVASTVTSFLILALLLFMVHRLRQRRLLLMVRRMNSGRGNGMTGGSCHYGMDDDGTIGYFPGREHLDFPPYDEPPPPYTFWKPPEAYFTPDDAPPSYEQSCLGNFSIPANGAALSAPPPPPRNINNNNNNVHILSNNSVNGFEPVMTVSSYRRQLNNMLASIVNQQVHRNNQQAAQQMRILQQHNNNSESSRSNNSSGHQQHHVLVEAPSSQHHDVIRSDAIYEDVTTQAPPPPQLPLQQQDQVEIVMRSSASTQTNPICSVGCCHGAFLMEQQPHHQRGSSGLSEDGGEEGGPGGTCNKCRSYNDVVQFWQKREMTRSCLLPGLPPPASARSSGCYTDPGHRGWSAVPSESSSSSSPSYEQRTVSPTSSDSSSNSTADYNLVVRTSSLDKTLNQLKERISGNGRKSSLTANRKASAVEFGNKNTITQQSSSNGASSKRPAAAAESAAAAVRSAKQLTSQQLQLRKERPRSYDYGDLKRVEELGERRGGGIGMISDSEGLRDSYPGLSMDRGGSSNNYCCGTYSSRASFGSENDSPCREGPASSTSLCSSLHLSSSTSSSSSILLPSYESRGGQQLRSAAAALPTTTVRPTVTPHNSITAATSVSRTGSTCSETGESRQQQQRSRNSQSPHITIGRAETRKLRPYNLNSSAIKDDSESIRNEFPPTEGRLRQVQVLRESNESYI